MQHPHSCEAPSLVGGFPHTDTEPHALVEEIFSRFTVLPAWPQSPVRTGEKHARPSTPKVCRERWWTDHRAGQLEAFYQAVVEQDVERFAIGRDYAFGIAPLPGKPSPPGRRRWP